MLAFYGNSERAQLAEELSLKIYEKSYTKDALKNFVIFTGKQLCWSLILTKLQACRPAILLKKRLTQVFSCEYYEIVKNAYFEEKPRVVYELIIQL